ncbi:hypothetical protein [Fodinicola feengrottensis]|uniref:PH domain-containing protein n=1 Tax=Fodinicola feengrottensis TaxID=435914 RepID=A0ABP4TD75_9ACTN|nr:hypothetical protein [Fodinicola feengrottensis]
MGRRRRRRWTRFRAWGSLLTVVIGILLWQRAWWPATIFTGILAFYLLWVRLTRCRVETIRHRPCLWRVRGLLGTCDFHTGYKKSIPVLARGSGFAGLPTLMWRRDFFGTMPEPQPSPGGAGTPQPAGGRDNYDWIMMAVGVAGVLIAVAALVRDLIAG